MIAKQIKGKDFYGLLIYHEEKVKAGNAHVLDTNIDLDEVISMTKEFNIVRQLRPRLQKAVYHVSLNLPPTDKLSDIEFSALAEDYLQGMGFDDNQYLIYMHTDQEHQHVHIIANRVKFSGGVVSDSGDYKRSQKLVRKLERKYRLTQLAENTNREKAALTQQEIEKAIRTGQVPVKLILQKHVRESLEQAKNIGQFIDHLQAKEIEPKFSISKSTERVMGISFKYDDIIFKGSSLGRKFSWNNIIKQIDYEQVRDSTIIFKNNAAERGTQKDANSSKGEARTSCKGAQLVSYSTKVNFKTSRTDGFEVEINPSELSRTNGLSLEKKQSFYAPPFQENGESKISEPIKSDDLNCQNPIASKSSHSKVKKIINSSLLNNIDKVVTPSKKSTFALENEEIADIDRKKRKKKGRRYF